MRKLQLFMLGLMLVATSLCKAETLPGVEFTTEVRSYLKDLPIEISRQAFVEVKFSMNEKNEIVIHSIDTRDRTLRKVIAQRLDHQKMMCSLDPAIKEYTLPIRIEL